MHQQKHKRASIKKQHARTHFPDVWIGLGDVDVVEVRKNHCVQGREKRGRSVSYGKYENKAGGNMSWELRMMKSVQGCIGNKYTAS